MHQLWIQLGCCETLVTLNALGVARSDGPRPDGAWRGDSNDPAWLADASPEFRMRRFSTGDMLRAGNPKNDTSQSDMDCSTAPEGFESCGSTRKLKEIGNTDAPRDHGASVR